MIFAAMLSKVLVKYAMHMSWFLLILGGASLFEKKWWSLPGGAMLLIGIVIFINTIALVYFNKSIIKNYSLLFLITICFLVLLIIAHLSFDRTFLAVLLAVMSIPVVAGWLALKSGKPSAASAKKKG